MYDCQIPADFVGKGDITHRHVTTVGMPLKLSLSGIPYGYSYSKEAAAVSNAKIVFLLSLS